MSIGFLNYDSSFFQLEVQGIANKDMKDDLSDKILSIEINEEMGKVVTGNIQILENDDYRYTNALRGRKFTLKWGYSDMDMSGAQEFRKANNRKELYSPRLTNRFVSGYIRNPSGSGDDKGVLIYNCSLVGREYVDKSSTNNKPFRSGTKADAIRQVFKDMGIDKALVDFRRGAEKITPQTAIRRDVNNFRFLAQYASEWRAMFRIATGNTVKNPGADPPEYNSVGLFCDFDKDKLVEDFLKETLGVKGDSSTFEYKMTSSPNVKSYTWNIGESGGGDNVRIVEVNGKMEFYHMRADTEKVTYYRLDTKKLADELAARADLKAQVKWVQEMAKKSDEGFKKLVDDKYFVSVEASTAPQGVGLSMTLETIGNPLYTCPARAKFGRGFPDMFNTEGSKGLILYQTKVTHRLSREGYTCSITVADSFSISGGSLVG